MVDEKIISKVFTARLKRILPNGVHADQDGFVWLKVYIGYSILCEKVGTM